MIEVGLKLVQLDWNKCKKLKIGAVSSKLSLEKKQTPILKSTYTEHNFLTLYPRIEQSN